MLLINHLLLLFTFTLCTTTEAIWEFNGRHDVSQIIQVEETKAAISTFCKNHPRVIAAYENFEGALLDSDLSDEEVDRVLGAALFAAEKHKNQTRKDSASTPYIIHPIGVAHYILAVSGDYTPEILMGALLHDTVEDTNTSFSEINEEFGPEVEGYVREVTDDKTLSRDEQKALQVRNAHDKTPGAAKIKMADKLYNLADIHLNPPPAWSSKRCDDYFRWAEQVIANLPDASPELKVEVEKLIKAYWGKRGASALDDQAGLEPRHLAS